MLVITVMNDTLSVASATTSGSTVTFGTAQDFPRISSATHGVYLRQVSDEIDVAAPNCRRTTTMRVQHQKSGTTQRSVLAFDVKRHYLNVDDEGNYTVPSVTTRVSRVAFQADIPEGMSSVEFLQDFRRIIGLLINNSEAVAKQLYNSEV